MGRVKKSKPKELKRSRSASSDETGDEKRKTASKKVKTKASSLSSSMVHLDHEFTDDETKDFSSSLLEWYHRNKRDLPWRTLKENLSSTDRAYAVLVSEVMLQQTQVVTVLPYYKKWMTRWPTFQHLAQASLNEVNEVWAGMGYYSRAKRLWEAAKKVDSGMNNQIPLTSKELQEHLPGVGKYTAGAVASIAFGEKCAAVDGNVIRVLSRVRCIGADSSSKPAVDHIWALSEQLVPASEPGNYNQAMMDLGATICTPKKPSCQTCPVAHVCSAYKRVEQVDPLRELQLKSCKAQINDIENVPCHLCLKHPWNSDLGVMNFPFKVKKAPPRNEITLVCVLHVTSQNEAKEYFLTQRPQKGLLAGLWEFPSIVFNGNREDGTEEEMQALQMELLEEQFGIVGGTYQPRFVAEVPHIFSHIHQLYVVYSLKLEQKEDVSVEKKQKTEWMNSDQILSSAISTAMKKVFKAACDVEKKERGSSSKKPTKLKNARPDSSSRKVSDFFKKVEKGS